jgi:iron complex outermembrane receptor protein
LDWSVRNTSFFRTNTLRRTLPNPAAFNEATGELQQRVFAGDEPFTSFFNNLDVVGNFTTGSINHKLLLGFEYGRENIFRRFFIGPAGSYPSINIFNPVYSNERFRFDTFPYNVQRDEFSTTYGFYLQDQISFTDNLILLLGGRYDIYEQETINRISDVRSERTSNAFSPRVGIVYRPIEPLSIYGSFTRGFEPSSASLADGSAPPPLTATQYELGAKLDLGRLAATLAYFDITQTNRPTPDPTNSIFSVVTGEVKSRGVELDISGEVLPGWNIIAAYTYTDAFVSQDNNTPVGNRFALAPRHSFSLWNTYEVQQGNLQGLGFGLGFYYVGEREGDIANCFTLPSYLRTDASIFYRQNNWRAQLNFQNLFNTDYFVGGDQFRPAGAAPGAPFSIVGSVSFTF